MAVQLVMMMRYLTPRSCSSLDTGIRPLESRSCYAGLARRSRFEKSHCYAVVKRTGNTGTGDEKDGFVDGEHRCYGHDSQVDICEERGSGRRTVRERVRRVRRRR